jgi:hypothetical protein
MVRNLVNDHFNGKSREQSILEDYWYPQWLPEGYALFAADKDGIYSFMNFQEDGGSGEIIVDEYGKTASVTFDTEHLSNKEVKIGTYEGMMFYDENMDWIAVIWPTEDRIVEVTLIDVRDEEIAMKVARGLHHIK